MALRMPKSPRPDAEKRDERGSPGRSTASFWQPRIPHTSVIWVHATMSEHLLLCATMGSQAIVASLVSSAHSCRGKR